MSQPTISNILDVANLCEGYCGNDISKSGLFGGGKDLRLPRKINIVKANVQFGYGYLGGGVAEVNATAMDVINAIGNNGDNIHYLINDPVLGSLSMGIYTKVNGDTTTTILAAHIAAQMNNNAYGYFFSGVANSVRFLARPGLGATINGGGRISVTGTVVAETKALALYNCFSLLGKAPGLSIDITVADPALGVITLATYIYQAGDVADATVLAGHLNTAIASNIYGYTTAVTGGFNLNVRPYAGLGASMNGITLNFTFSGGNSSTNFTGGVNGTAIISNTLTQFSGGVTAVPENAGLRAAANYLYALCAPYSARAQYILSGGTGGGSVTPIGPNPNGRYRSLDLQVQPNSIVNYPADGESSFINHDLIGATEFNLMVIDATNYQLGVGFSFDTLTGEVTLLNGNTFVYTPGAGIVTLFYFK